VINFWNYNFAVWIGQYLPGEYNRERAAPPFLRKSLLVPILSLQLFDYNDIKNLRVLSM